MSQPRVLIPTYPGDFHAVVVALALADREHEALLWYGSDFPALQVASIDIRGTEVQWEVSGPELEARGPFGIFWMRRPTPPVFPSTLHPGDLPVAQREWQHFLGGLYHLAAPDAFWVNPLASRFRADLKPVQLREAARAGLTVPPTRMSNDPAQIRAFLEEFRGRTIYKPFYPAQWNHDDGAAMLLTSDMTLDDLPEDEILKLTPGIFQVKVEKAHELRVTILGEHVITARLLSQESETTRLDWRAAGPQVRVEPDRLPESVERACLRLMRSLDIVFGAFDFIVTPKGEHVFLEVNPAGQFLWVEESCPELRLLAPFVDFLLARRPDFRWSERSPNAIRYESYRQAAIAKIEATLVGHTRPEEVFISNDEPSFKALAENR